ncbi:unnamed protein product [Spirodela intermedia]|uniref:Uncharacterized protein n=1 Tax=Spirodela intermedia TaxID=51605 RepID=A0A7I8ICQ3_SPIIN|nr:unnamed protein product [Spirodela intermedia]CAA6655597.1 unnamed protein product [Spirodela intermedia]
MGYERGDEALPVGHRAAASEAGRPCWGGGHPQGDQHLGRHPRMHHDPALWGSDANEFRPERFSDSLHGGCKHRMGFLPFGFGGRLCIGRNLAIFEYKILLSSILRRFSLALSPSYVHSPSMMLSSGPPWRPPHSHPPPCKLNWSHL